MTHFLARVAARAVGGATVARPRPAAPFEALAPETSEEMAAPETPAPASRRSHAAPFAPEPMEAPGSVTAAEKGTAQVHIVAGERAAPEATPGQLRRRPPGRAQRAARRTDSPITPTGAEAPPARMPAPSVPAEHDTSEPGAARAATVVAALPITLGRAPEDAPTPARRASRHAAPEEPVPVRIHIGRLEVRAEVREAPQPRPTRNAREPEALSLDDYLRGKR